MCAAKVVLQGCHDRHPILGPAPAPLAMNRSSMAVICRAETDQNCSSAGSKLWGVRCSWMAIMLNGVMACEVHSACTLSVMTTSDKAPRPAVGRSGIQFACNCHKIRWREPMNLDVCLYPAGTITFRSSHPARRARLLRSPPRFGTAIVPLKLQYLRRDTQKGVDHQ